ncbi:MAG: hypothetical protein QM711_06065 [Micropruina sp.]|uniref:hypothetical protein n=1 Tax=Micropruina sp. TaxID=2737536 RepID=UPI0039E2A690
MGLFRNLLGPNKAAVSMLVNGPTAPIKSPWSGTQLKRIVLSELAGVESREVARIDAMRIPAVARARGLICGTLSRHPLTLWRYIDGVNDERLAHSRLDDQHHDPARPVHPHAVEPG